MNKLKDKYKFEHIEAGHTPDGHSIYERIQLEDKNSRDHVEIHKGGSAAYFVNGNEHTHDTEAYQDMGIDTDSKEFKAFEAGLKKDENYNTRYIEDFLKNAPELTAEKRQEIDKQRFDDLQKQIAADKEYQANGGFLAEMREAESNWNTQTIKDEYGIKSDYEAGLLAEGYKDREDFENELTSHQNEFSEHDIKREDAVKTLTQWAVDHDQTKDTDQKVWDQNAMDTGYRDPEDTYYPDSKTSDHVQKKFDELSQEGKTEIAKPGRTYSGNVIEVGEDITIQKTKSGKFIIHETENLPGIKEEDSGSAARIVYDGGGKGDITAKSNDMSIEKEKEAEKKSASFDMEK